MINEANYNYVKNLVIGRLEKYENYVCYTNSNTNYNTNDYDIICAFNSDSANVEGYTFTFDNAEVCRIDTNSYSYSSTNQIERLSCSTYNFSSTIDNYESIYTNLESTFPSIVSNIEYDKLNNPIYSLDLNYFYLLVLLLCLPIVIFFCKKLFGVD